MRYISKLLPQLIISSNLIRSLMELLDNIQNPVYVLEANYIVFRPFFQQYRVISKNSRHDTIRLQTFIMSWHGERSFISSHFLNGHHKSWLFAKRLYEIVINDYSCGRLTTILRLGYAFTIGKYIID